MSGKFFWYELVTTDTQAAADFYNDVIGWNTQDSGVPDANYTLFRVKDQGVAGLMTIPGDTNPRDANNQGMTPFWIGYIAVDDVPLVADRIVNAGGKLHREPIEVPGVIHFAMVSDPQGTGFMIGKGLPKDPPPPLPMGTPGTVGWHELYTTDWEAAYAFYHGLFGWTKDRAFDMGPMGTYQLFTTGGAEAVGGMMNKPDNIPRPHWGFYFNVAAIDAAAERVKAGGGEVLNGPMEVPNGNWIIQCRDPQGATFNLVAPTR